MINLNNIKWKQIMNLFRDFRMLDSVPVMVCKLPTEIFDWEIKHFVQEGRKYKNHPLNFLRQHYNAGENKFQIAVPRNLCSDAFVMPYLIYLGQFFLYQLDGIDLEDSLRGLSIRQASNHFDNIDFWINYAQKGDYNPNHTHSDNQGLSGVIYVTGNGNPTVFDNTTELHGVPGEIAIFPAGLLHKVEEQTQDNERITMSFNLRVDL